MTIKDADELPKLLAQLKADKFYGDVTITFRQGAISRLVTAQSQVFEVKDGRNPHDRKPR